MPSVVLNTKPSNCHVKRGSCISVVGKGTRGVIGAPSQSSLRSAPARVIMTESVQEWSGWVLSRTGLIDVVWISHGNKLIRWHTTQQRRCSEREVPTASLKGHVPISLPNVLSPGQYNDLFTCLPTRDDLRFGEVHLEEPQFVPETIEHSLAPSAHPGTVVNPLREHFQSLSRSACVGRPSGPLTFFL